MASNAFTDSGFGTRGKRERLEAAYDHLDGETIDGIGHRILTIHGAKGAEENTVFLFDGLSRKIIKEHGAFPSRSEDEARVFFVGATRAETNLYVVEYPEEPRIDLPRT